MKKISHKERIEASKASIAKTSKREGKRISPKTRKIASISGITLATGGVVAGIAVGLTAAVNTSALTTYPKLDGAIVANDFLAHKTGADTPESKFTTRTSGTQTIINATKGPVRFISNYVGLFDEEKMDDFLSWFYNDVSWGPEIAALSSVNFLSGVQAEDGKVTLGYHTTSREGSTIIMSPDVQFNWNKSTHKVQSVAFYVVKKLLKTDADAEIQKIFPDFKRDYTKQPTYVALSKSASFIDTFYHYLKYSWQAKFEVNLNAAGDGIETDSNTGLVTPIDSARKQQTFSGSAAFGMLYDQLSNPKINFVQKKDYIQRIFGTDVETTDQIGFFANLFTKSDDFFRNLISQNSFVFSKYAFEDDDDFNALDGKTGMGKLYDESLDPDAYHLQTQTSHAAYETSPAKIQKLMQELLVNTGYLDKTNKEDKIAALLNVPYFYFTYNGQMSKGAANTHTNYAMTSMHEMYKELEGMSSSDIDNVDASWIYSRIFSNKQVGDYSPAAIKGLIEGFYKFSEDQMTQLSQDMDDRIHPGKVIAGKRTTGLPIYKDETEREDGRKDSFYDSITRRISQDLLYTISHEYGHHTTMWYAQDISRMDGLKSVGTNSGDTTAEPDRTVVPFAEIIENTGLGTYADAAKYDLFKSGFSTEGYHKVLDDTTDGDSRTDLAGQRYKTDFLIGKASEGRIEEVENTESGIEGFNKMKPVMSPIYLGKTEKGFGAVIDGNTLAKELLGFAPKEGDTTKPDFVNHYDVQLYDDIKKSLADKDKTTDADFVNNSKEAIIKSLETSGLFGNWDAYEGVVTPSVKHPGINYVDNDSYNNGGMVGLVYNTSLPDKMDPATHQAFKNIYHALEHGKAYEDEDKAAKPPTGRVFFNTEEAAIAQMKLSDIQLVIDQLLKYNYTNIHGPNKNISIFNAESKIFELGGGDMATATVSSVKTVTDTLINGWTLGTKPTENTEYQEVGHSAYFNTIWAEAEKLKAKFNSRSEAPVQSVTGEMLLRSLYQTTGKATKAFFEKLFDTSDLTEISEFVITNGAEGTETKLNIEDLTLDEKFTIFTGLAKKVLSGLGATTEDAFKTKLGEEIKAVTSGTTGYKFKLSTALQTQLANLFKTGAMVFTMANGQTSPSAVSFTFTDPKDPEKYHTKFSTVVDGVVPPDSFFRYTSTYAEALTRAWNQLAYVANPELLTKPGEYFDGDATRFASMGEMLYDIQQKPGTTDIPTGKITDEGKKVRAMYAKFFNTDKTISAMLRARATGLYTIMGYTPAGSEKEDSADHIAGLVFTKPGADGKATKDNFVSEVDVIYDVDNYHYYTTHGDADTVQRLTDRHSWMTKFSVLGDFENSLLKSGEYDVWKWIDKNKDGKVTDDELEAIHNSEIQNDGLMNSNGKVRDTAEIVGNPDKSTATDEFRIKVGDIKV